MALTQIEKDLVAMFRLMKDDGRFEDKAVLPVLVMLKTDEMKMKLMEYMLAVDESGEVLTQKMVVQEACRIFDAMTPPEEKSAAAQNACGDCADCCPDCGTDCGGCLS